MAGRAGISPSPQTAFLVVDLATAGIVVRKSGSDIVAMCNDYRLEVDIASIAEDFEDLKIVSKEVETGEVLMSECEQRAR